MAKYSGSVRIFKKLVACWSRSQATWLDQTRVRNGQLSNRATAVITLSSSQRSPVKSADAALAGAGVACGAVARATVVNAVALGWTVCVNSTANRVSRGALPLWVVGVRDAAPCVDVTLVAVAVTIGVGGMVAVTVAVGIAVAVWVAVGVAVTVWLGVMVAVAVGVWLAVGLAVAAVWAVAVGVSVAVGDGRGVGVGGKGVAVGGTGVAVGGAGVAVNVGVGGRGVGVGGTAVGGTGVAVGGGSGVAVGGGTVGSALAGCSSFFPEPLLSLPEPLLSSLSSAFS